MQIHLRRDGKTVGPYSLAEVQRQLAAGELSPATLAWRDGLPDWRPVTEIAGATVDIPPVPAPPVYAGFWIRVAATLLDTLLFSGTFALIEPRATWNHPFGSAALVDSGLEIIASWFYAALLESSPLQATLGKLACGLRVTDEGGKRISFGRATGRFFAKYLSLITFGIGFLMVAFTRRKQGLHDLLAKTLVIRR